MLPKVNPGLDLIARIAMAVIGMGLPVFALTSSIRKVTPETDAELNVVSEKTYKDDDGVREIFSKSIPNINGYENSKVTNLKAKWQILVKEHYNPRSCIFYFKKNNEFIGINEILEMVSNDSKNFSKKSERSELINEVARVASLFRNKELYDACENSKFGRPVFIYKNKGSWVLKSEKNEVVKTPKWFWNSI